MRCICCITSIFGEFETGCQYNDCPICPSLLYWEISLLFPQVNLSLINGNSRGVETALQEHRIDLGLVEGIFRLPNLKYTSFLQDELVAVVHANSKLDIQDEITPEELPNIPLVLMKEVRGRWMSSNVLCRSII